MAKSQKERSKASAEKRQPGSRLGLRLHVSVWSPGHAIRQTRGRLFQPVDRLQRDLWRIRPATALGI